MSDFKLLINGALVDGDATLDVVNPATEEVFATCARASKGQLDQAVAAAQAAFPAWRETPAPRRGAWEKRSTGVPALRPPGGPGIFAPHGATHQRRGRAAGRRATGFGHPAQLTLFELCLSCV